ncbi:MAG: DcaP family trimeric outer membrane transporter [Gammaproteobacteria bacterium]
MTLPTSSAQRVTALATALALAGSISTAIAAEGQKSFEVYGFAQLDYIQDFGRVNPDWEDTLRPSRIPTDSEEFGDDGQAMISVKQSRFGIKATLPTSKGDINTKFEFDMFGVGSDAGETTIRLRHAYGEWGSILAGQTNSLFMDGDVFPNVIDYWGPTGMVFLRNPQIRWTPVKGDTTFAVAIENPGNDIDSGQFREVADFPGAQGDEEYPDLTGQFRMNTGFGHFQVAGIMRWIGAEVLCNTSQTDPDALDFCPNGVAEVTYDDNDFGWGINLTSVINVLEKDAIRAGIVYGEGIASYMNDGGMDAGPDRAVGNDGVQVEAVQLTGVTLYYDHWWNDQYSSSIGYSFTEVDNTAGQTPDTYKQGQYASANLLYYPVENVMIGGELLWGEREDFDGANNDDTRIQISVKYNFGTTL